MSTQNNNRNFGGVFKKAASTAFKVGDLVSINTSGFLVPGGSTKVEGISNETVAATDATTRDLNISRKASGVIFTVPVITGTPAQTQVGETFDVSSTDARGINLTAQVNNQLKVERIIDATTVEVSIV